MRRQQAELLDAYLRGTRRLRWDAVRLATERQRRLRELLVLSTVFNDRVGPRPARPANEVNDPSRRPASPAPGSKGHERSDGVP